MTATADKLLTQREVSELLGVSVKTLQLLRRNQKLAFVRFGHRTIRFRESEVSKFVERSRPS
jgi:excisionase family DNA binding protein